MKTVKVQTASLTGLAIDWAVAKATGLTPTIMGNSETLEDYIAIRNSGAPWRFSPSLNWSDGGPIIEKYGLGVAKFYEPVDGQIKTGCEWAALWRDDKKRMDGPTALIAACRAIVAFNFGETVEIPASLLNQ